VKFGVFSLMEWPEDRSRGEVFRDELSGLTAAEDEGYDSIWLGEHPLSRYGIGSSVQFSAASLAARTSWIRIGTAVTILPSFHPLRLAEELAMLDIMSGGRLDWGVGRGHPGQELSGLGVDPETSQSVFQEQVEVVKRAWRGEPFAHEGEFFQFPTLECLPTPEQQPHPPIYIAAHSRDTLEWAGEAGHPLLADAFSSVQRLEQNRRVHRESAQRSGVDLSGFAGPTLRQVYCGESMQQAREQAGSALLYYYRSLASVASPAAPNDAVPESYSFPGLFGEQGFDLDEDPDACLDFLFENCAIVGDEAYCRDKIEELQGRIGLDSLLCWQSFGNLPHEASMASQRRLIEKVAPSFR
jgi:alkanesulfonate monooxygenase SsuD/methylene tetrahydromethanopterin reductase-like flavin-dependent oxidoreductase (luciferase family)